MKFAAALFAVTLAVAGCSGSEEPKSVSTSAADTAKAQATQLAKAQAQLAEQTKSARTIDIEIVNGAVIPLGERVEVKVGAPIILHIISDADEEFHVHSDPERVYAVAAGGEKSFTFTIDVSGQVAVEAHNLDVTVVELVVRP